MTLADFAKDFFITKVIVLKESNIKNIQLHADLILYRIQSLYFSSSTVHVYLNDLFRPGEILREEIRNIM